MDRPTRGVAPGGGTAGVGAACQAVADHLAADGRLQPRVWLERGGRLGCAARAGGAQNRPVAGAPAPAVVRTVFASASAGTRSPRCWRPRAPTRRSRPARLRAAVRRAGLGVTLSIGVAVPHPDEPDACVLARADRALYRVKASGRDGVALAADEPLPIAPPL